MKKCPFCSEDIQDDAKKCRYCREWIEDIKNETMDGGEALDDKYQNEAERLFKNRVNPYGTSVFLGGKDPSAFQLYAGYMYFRRRDEGLAKSLKKILEGMKLDFDKLEKAAEDMDNLNYFQVIMDFINKRFPDKVKKNEGEGFHKRIGSEGVKLYTEKATLKDLMIMLDDEFLKIMNLSSDFLSSYVHGNEGKKVMGLIFLDKNTKETCKKYVEKAEKVIKKSKEKYDLHFMLDKAQVIFHNIYDIVMGLEDDSTKNLFLRWLSLTETLFLNYEWIRFLVDGYIKSDENMIELVKANGYDTKKKLSEKDNFLIADSITCAKVIKDIEELNIIRPDFRRDLIGE